MHMAHVSRFDTLKRHVKRKHAGETDEAFSAPPVAGAFDHEAEEEGGGGGGGEVFAAFGGEELGDYGGDEVVSTDILGAFYGWS